MELKTNSERAAVVVATEVVLEKSSVVQFEWAWWESIQVLWRRLIAVEDTEEGLEIVENFAAHSAQWYLRRGENLLAWQHLARRTVCFVDSEGWGLGGRACWGREGERGGFGAPTLGLRRRSALAWCSR